MKSFLLLALLALALAQTVTNNRPGLAGSGMWSASLLYHPLNGTDAPGGAPYTRWVRIEQHPVRKEWNSLGTSFTFEFWASQNPPTCNPTTGAWDQVACNTQNETRFLPLVNRHPGLRLNNEWAHFESHFIRTANGTVFVAWAGCGCDAPPRWDGVNGEQPNLQTCGYGYLLNSDSPNMIGGPFYAVPGRWNHYAVTFDGDGTETDARKSLMAKLYINGQLRLVARWGNPAYNPNRGDVCWQRPMQWFRDMLGWNNDVRLGYLDNQDDPSRGTDREGNPQWRVYGFSGLMDELRIWRDARTEKQIGDNFDLVLQPRDIKDSKPLVAYYNWNRLPPSEDRTRKFPNEVTVSDPDPTVRGYPWGFPVTSPLGPDNAALWQFAANRDGNGVHRFLTINDRIFVTAKRQETATPPIANKFMWRGLDPDPSSLSVNGLAVDDGVKRNVSALFPPFEAITFMLWDYSARWKLADVRNELLLHNENRKEINVTDLRVAQFWQNETMTLYLNCSDVLCSNFNGTFRDWWAEYYVVSSSVETPTAKLYLQIESECDGYFDACGVCNGRNETCQCVVYHNFRNTRMAYVLLQFMLDYIVEKIDSTVSIMQESLAIVSKPAFNAAALSAVVENQIRDLMNFYNGCLSNYCDSVSTFNAQLAMLPKPHDSSSAGTKREGVVADSIDLVGASPIVADTIALLPQ